MSTKTRSRKNHWEPPHTATRQPSAKAGARGSTRRPKRRRAAKRHLSWTTGLAIAAVIVFGLMLYVGNRKPEGGSASGVAPAFTLASTAGGRISLSDYRGKDVLLYFNEGVGCDACFYQMVDIEKSAQTFADAGVVVVPIVANPATEVRPELARFGLMTPYLIDSDTRVSQEYGMLGKGMHANLPGHGFVLVDRTGHIRWHMEYPSMYVSSVDLLKAIQPYL